MNKAMDEKFFQFFDLSMREFANCKVTILLSKNALDIL